MLYVCNWDILVEFQGKIKKQILRGKKITCKNNFMDETGVEPMTFRLQGKRATNYATRPVVVFHSICS